MSDVRMIVNRSSLSLGSIGPATGDIALTLGDGTVFPHPQWNDFIVVVLGAWASALLRLLQKESHSERVHFMEGPYAVDIRSVGGGLLHLRALERPSRQRAGADVPAVEFAESVISAAEEVLSACRDAGCWTEDAEKLAGVLPVLRAELIKRGTTP